jgi:hypothetical protein
MKLPKIRKYHVWIPKGNCIATDNESYAEKQAALKDGQVYVDTRYKARKRLQRLYIRALYNGANQADFDYPDLLQHDFGKAILPFYRF